MEMEKGHPMWNAGSVLVGLPNVLAYLVVGDQISLEGYVGPKDSSGHASLPREVVHQWSDDLVETFVYVDAGCNQLGLLGEVTLHLKLGEEPSLLSSSTRDASKHLWFCPSLDPCFQVFDPNRGPKPVYHRGDFKNAIGLRVASIARVFAQKDSTS